MLAFVSLYGQSVSDQLRQRTGNVLPEAPSDPSRFTLPPGISLDTALSGRDAVAIALWNNAELHRDLARLDVSRADLVEAGQFRNPNFSTLLPVGPKPFEFLLTWPVEELLSRRSRVKAATIDVEAVTTGLVQNGLNLIRDTLSAHAELWAAERRAGTLANTADLAARIADFAKKRRDIGEGTGLTVALASADSQSAINTAESARGDIEVARARLRWLMGMRGTQRPVSASLGPLETLTIPAAESLIETALSNRPDLRGAELNVTVNAERAKWERSRVLALIAPALSVKEISGAGTRSGPGINMEIPLLSRNGGRISRADAEATRAISDYVAMKDRVELEVVEARERALAAQSSLRRLVELTRPPIEESVRITERAYRGGDATRLDVFESTRRLNTTELAEIDARLALARALAELERAIGRSL
ncbi:MAG TPA: TolC family protein [Terriglobia bacterium]|nr:TolC family protein [Terriglobia bacterium]